MRWQKVITKSMRGDYKEVLALGKAQQDINGTMANLERSCLSCVNQVRITTASDEISAE